MFFEESWLYKECTKLSGFSERNFKDLCDPYEVRFTTWTLSRGSPYRFTTALTQLVPTCTVRFEIGTLQLPYSNQPIVLATPSKPRDPWKFPIPNACDCVHLWRIWDTNSCSHKNDALHIATQMQSRHALSALS